MVSPRGVKVREKNTRGIYPLSSCRGPRPRRAQPTFKRNHEWTRGGGISDCAPRPTRFITHQWCVVRDLSFHPWQAISIDGRLNCNLNGTARDWDETERKEKEQTRYCLAITSRLIMCRSHDFSSFDYPREVHKVFTEHPVGQWNYR